MIQQNSLYDFGMKNIFYGLKQSGDSKLCDHFAMVTWEFFVGIAPGRNLPYEVFFVQL
jgi:hypothetical protein